MQPRHEPRPAIRAPFTSSFGVQVGMLRSSLARSSFSSSDIGTGGAFSAWGVSVRSEGYGNCIHFRGNIRHGHRTNAPEPGANAPTSKTLNTESQSSSSTMKSFPTFVPVTSTAAKTASRPLRLSTDNG